MTGAVAGMGMLAFVLGYVVGQRMGRRAAWWDAAELLRATHRAHGIWEPLSTSCLASLYARFRGCAEAWGAEVEE